MSIPTEDRGDSPVLVTGATGLLGNNITRLLLEQGRSVRVLVRERSDPRPLKGLAVQAMIGDIADEASVARAIDGAGSVVHSAGCVLMGWRNADVHDRVNRLGTRHVATLARRAGVRMLHISTMNTLGVGSRKRPADEQWSAAPNVPCQYVLSKQAGEREVQIQIERGLDAVTVHPALMFGPWDWKPSSGKLLLQVVRQFTPVAPSGGSSVCDVRDVAQAITTALDRAPTGRHFVLAGQNLTYLKLWRIMAQVAGRHGPWCPFGPMIGFVAGRSCDLWGHIRGREPDVNSAVIKLGSRFHYFSSARAERELGYHTRPIEESIEDAWQWYKEHGYA